MNTRALYLAIGQLAVVALPATVLTAPWALLGPTYWALLLNAAAVAGFVALTIKLCPVQPPPTNPTPRHHDPEEPHPMTTEQPNRHQPPPAGTPPVIDLPALAAALDDTEPEDHVEIVATYAWWHRMNRYRLTELVHHLNHNQPATTLPQETHQQ